MSKKITAESEDSFMIEFHHQLASQVKESQKFVVFKPNNSTPKKVLKLRYFTYSLPNVPPFSDMNFDHEFYVRWKRLLKSLYPNQSISAVMIYNDLSKEFLGMFAGTIPHDAEFTDVIERQELLSGEDLQHVSEESPDVI